jgi:hypothetical protein
MTTVPTIAFKWITKNDAKPKLRQIWNIDTASADLDPEDSDYPRLIPLVSPYDYEEYIIDVDENFKAFVKSCAIFKGLICFEGGLITLLKKTSKVKLELPCPFVEPLGAPVERFALDAEYLHRILDQNKKKDRILYLQFSGPQRPVILSHINATYIVAPVVLNNH